MAALLASGCGATLPAEDWVTLSRSDWVLGVDVTGVLAASSSEAVGPPQIPGVNDYKIARMAPDGSPVPMGEVVVAFDTSDLERRLQEKETERDAAAAEIERRVSDAKLLRRDEVLALAEAEGAERKALLLAERSSDFTASLELEVARLDHELAQKRLDYQRRKAKASAERDAADITALREKRARAEAQVNFLRDAIARMTIRAPRAAAAIYTPNWQDQKKKVGDGVWRGERILELASLDDMVARATIDEADVARLDVGQAVSLRLEAHPEDEYLGHVASVGNLIEPPSPESPLGIVRVQIALDHTDPLRMRPGMRFRGIAESERLRALRIPTAAVFMTERGPVAYKKHGSGYETLRLELGRAQHEYVEVLGGLSEGDEVSRSDLARAERGGS
jgi:HlyD family secretion protein